ncbi:MAG: ABC transporter permease [Chitinophagaceae bacterium]|nr:ABC transporter permease [Chitinophagaceae bacterium]
MLKNLILLAFRHFKKDKWFSLLNVLGLSIGIIFSLLLVFYVMDELSYDRYHKKADRILRVVSYVNEPENKMKWATTQFTLAPTLKKDYPEVEEAARFAGAGRMMYKNGEKKFYEEKIFYADSNLFKIFSHKFLQGNAESALMEPNSMVLTKTLAEKYYGNASNAVGQSLQNSQGDIYKITAVVEDVPKNSHIIFNGLISASTLPADFGGSWGQFDFYTYVLIRPNTNIAAFEKKLLPMYEKYMAPLFAKYNIKIHYGLQPITAIHLHSDMQNEPEDLGSMSYIYIFSAVALFMLMIACINYMNMATARSARRAKEIGIRKVAGSTKSQLVVQFLSESVLITIFSLLISLVAIYFLLPFFNTLSGKFISFSSLLNGTTLWILFAIIVFVGLLGGAYPAFYLAKFQPLTVLKGPLAKSSGNVVLRRVLVVTQFSISMVMLICTWVVYGQLQYMKTKDLGFNKEQVLSIVANGDGDIRGKVSSFQNEIRKNPKVVSVSAADASPGGANINFNLFSVEAKTGFVDKGIDVYSIDENYLTNLGIKLANGRDFTGAADTLHSILVNESLVKDLGWQEPIGKRVKFPGDTSGRYLEVIGVMKDFHVKSLYNPIMPLILRYRPNRREVQVKLAAGNIGSAVADVEKTWKSIFPELTFQYTFLDQDFNSQYAADQKRGKIFTSFSTLTILITCLGLLGLIAFTTEQRSKEISIRKVMGAGTTHIVSLIAKNFVLLVLLSCVIAFPVAYYFMHKWLDVFPYKEGLKLSTFLFSALVVLVIAMVTVSFHTIKVAISNPVNSLKTE